MTDITALKRGRPILFSGPMVRALLAGTKTQTRRVVKCNSQIASVGTAADWNRHKANPAMRTPRIILIDDDGSPFSVPCPYGQPGDKLWVRETWGYRGACYDSATPDLQDIYIRYRADDPQPELMRAITCKRGEHDANLPKQRKRRDGEDYDEYHNYLNRYWEQWRPAIHLPRWASRITLEITGVRVERLQEISEADAKAEGIGPHRKGGWWWEQPPDGIEGTNHFGAKTARDAYRALWESINGGGSWAANPWVWVVGFERIGRSALDGRQSSTHTAETGEGKP